MIPKPSHTLFPFYQNESLGFFNDKLEVVLPPIYGGGTPWTNDTPFGNRHSIFTDGLALVKTPDLDRLVFITPDGKEIPDAGWGKDFQPPRAFREGRAAVCINKKWGFIDTQGQLVVPPQYDDVESFSCGLASVFNNETLVGFIDRQGKIVIPNRHKPGDRFSDSEFSEGLISVIVGGKEGFMDTAGQWVIDPFFDYVASVSYIVSFSEGLAAFRIKDAQGEKRYGYIDRTGKVAIPPQFINAFSFREGMAPAAVKADAPYDVKWGYINPRGEFVIPPRFGRAFSFYEGMAAVREEPGGPDYLPPDYGLIDKTGQYVVKPGGSPRLTSIDPFCNGLARVRLHDSKREREWETHYMDKTGRIVWSSHFDPEKQAAMGDLPQDQPRQAATQHPAPAQKLRGLPGQTVPQTGWWTTPALSGDQGRRHFDAGQKFPETNTTQWGDVIWLYNPEQQ
jgi:hypothetical protein